MTWPEYPTDPERRLVAHRAASPRLGSNLGSIFFGSRVAVNTTLNLPAANIGDVTLDLELPAGVTLILQGATTTAATGTLSAVTPTAPATLWSAAA